MNIIASIDGGDLGRANKITSFWDIPSTIEIAGNIFTNIRNQINKPMILSYGIEVSGYYKNIMEPLLLSMEIRGLPEGCRFYKTDGIRIFDIRGVSGGIATSCIFYLICEGTKE